MFECISIKQKPRTHLILKCYKKVRIYVFHFNVFDKKDEEEQASSENLLSDYGDNAKRRRE
jgi:hypothetical protein